MIGRAAKGRLGLRVAALVGAALVGAVSVLSCQSSVAVTYTGKELAPRLAAEEIAVFAGSEPPEGYAVLGVVTVACTSLDGATGIFEEPCSDALLTTRARERAAAAGATALLDVACRNREDSRFTERSDAGSVSVSVRETLTCQGTALRHEGARPKAEIAAEAPGRRVRVGGVPVAVDFRPANDAGIPEGRPSEAVGELEVVTPGAVRLGTLSAVCLAGCSRNTARMAIRQEASRIGAAAFAALKCELVADRWRCEAVALE